MPNHPVQRGYPLTQRRPGLRRSRRCQGRQALAESGHLAHGHFSIGARGPCHITPAALERQAFWVGPQRTSDFFQTTFSSACHVGTPYVVLHCPPASPEDPTDTTSGSGAGRVIATGSQSSQTSVLAEVMTGGRSDEAARGFIATYTDLPCEVARPPRMPVGRVAPVLPMRQSDSRLTGAVQ